MRLRPIFLVLPLILSACATTEATRTAEPVAMSGTPSSISSTRITEAASSPLNDLNVVQISIPLVLIEAQKGAYAPPADPTCAGLAATVLTLDIVLGPDLDAQSCPTDPSLFEKGTGVVGDVAVDALRGAAEGLVPFRSWVRKLSGAERHSKQVVAAITAGTVRRAYLKGLGQTLGCQAPAAPLRQPKSGSGQTAELPDARGE